MKKVLTLIFLFLQVMFAIPTKNYTYFSTNQCHNINISNINGYILKIFNNLFLYKYKIEKIFLISNITINKKNQKNKKEEKKSNYFNYILFNFYENKSEKHEFNYRKINNGNLKHIVIFENKDYNYLKVKTIFFILFSIFIIFESKIEKYFFLKPRSSIFDLSNFFL